ncbi:MAG: sigma-70 family RNA polymerase sigma factor [Acidobacteriota bacterium]|nr:sigma-70 family RNA polymerase sigma factor [Acidobacteriota bacterium]
MQNQPINFDRLLNWLAADHEQAAESYQLIRRRLIRFFESQACPLSEDCADETIHRVAARLGEGVKIEAGDPYAYFRGVARNVLHEQWRRQQRSASLDELPTRATPSLDPAEAERRSEESDNHERRLRCLEKCLGELPNDARQLFLDYHQQQTAKIDQRAKLAERLGIDITALRNRVTRLRKRLEQCLLDCIGSDTN